MRYFTWYNRDMVWYLKTPTVQQLPKLSIDPVCVTSERR